MEKESDDLLISRHTKINYLIARKGEVVIERLVTLNAHFKKLRNPLLRKLLAGRVNIEGACKIAGCSLPDFMHAMLDLGFVFNDTGYTFSNNVEEDIPVCLNDLELVELDVRPVLSGGADPLKLILQKVDALTEKEALKLINSFEPLPLIHMLNKRGFEHRVEKQSEECVYTYFFKNTAAGLPTDKIKVDLPVAASAINLRELIKRFEGKIQVIDVRTLEMPGPMLTILAALDSLPSGLALFVHHKKVPLYLLPHLEERGFKYAYEKIDEDNVSLIIY